MCGVDSSSVPMNLINLSRYLSLIPATISWTASSLAEDCSITSRIRSTLSYHVCSLIMTSNKIPSKYFCLKYQQTGLEIHQVWPLTQFFLFPFCKNSMICLEGKSMTPHRGNTILFGSSQQLPRLRLGPSKGFLS